MTIDTGASTNVLAQLAGPELGPPQKVASWPCTEPAWTTSRRPYDASSGTSVLEHLAWRLLEAGRARGTFRPLAWLDTAGPVQEPGTRSVLTGFPIKHELMQDCDGSSASSRRIRSLLDAMADGPTADADASFQGGWILQMGYEAGPAFEQMVLRGRRDMDVPVLSAALHPVWFEHDRDTSTLTLWSRMHGSLDEEFTDQGGAALPALGAWCHWAEDALRSPYDGTTPMWSAPKPLRPTEIRPNLSTDAMGPAAQTSLDHGAFIDGVRRAQDAIREGEIFQANVARRFSLPYDDDPFAAYIRLRRINPSPFGAYLEEPWGAIASNSPERLVRVRPAPQGFAASDGSTSRQRVVDARPIAGTRPRGEDKARDEQQKGALASSAKERCEHTMLVDLVRNDLGKVCLPGTVRVQAFQRVERYSHVHHMVSDVTGELRDDARPSDVVASVFPGGTITGAPKLRSIEVIDRIEPVQRGPYTGTLGFVDAGGTMDLNILIRTVVFSGGSAHWYAGAGIVHDSDADAEFDETNHKAAAMRLALTRVSEEEQRR